MVVGEGVFLAAVGIGIGLGGALALSRVLSSLLSGIQATDPAVYALVSATLLAVALFASFIPARRAANVDPLVALRYE
jgi:putative ABC transport system permease protein